MYENIFQRVEEKYILTKKERDQILEKIAPYIKKDKFYESKICNIYFDTCNSDLIINSIEKPLFKEKIRLRSYGVPSLNDDVFLERKEKYEGIVGKRRTKMKLKEFYNYLNTNNYDTKNQIMKEIDYCFKYYDLYPVIYIAYDRISYKGVYEKELRITFDEKLRSRREGLKLELGDKGDLYFKEDIYLMEIKTLSSIPLWFVKVLSELKIYPKSFSKYGNIYMKEINNKEELKYVD